jgi:microcystin-dependent protein
MYWTGADGVTPLPFWLEGGANTALTRVWVRVPLIPANGAETIHLLYGNPAATSQSSAPATFIRELGGVRLAYKLEEGVGATVPDYSGNGATGAILGTPNWSAQGRYYGALEFDGVSNIVQLPAGNLVGASDDPLSVSVWVYPTRVLPPDGPNLVFVRLTQDSQLLLCTYQTDYFAPGFRGFQHITFPYDINTMVNQWTHVVLSYNGGDKNSAASFALYVNGVSIAPVASVLGAVGNTCNDSAIGADNNAGCTGNFQHFEGRMVHVRAYDRALGPGEIADLYAHYGYVSSAYPGKELVRRFSSFEPAITLGAEQAASTSQQSVLFVESGSGNVGVGTPSPGSRLSVNGLIETLSGGIKFPDGTIQTTAGGEGGPSQAAFDTLPLGTILAWHRDFSGTPELPEGWVQCDGQPLDDPLSPYHGLVIPDLNNAPNAYNEGGSFLRGGATSGVAQEDQFQGHKHSVNASVWVNSPSSWTTPISGSVWMNPDGFAMGQPDDSGYGAPRFGAETRPANMSVVWIMKVRPTGVGDAQSVYIKSNFQFLDYVPLTANTNQTLTESVLFSGNYQSYNAPPITITLPTTGRFFVRGQISYFTRVTGALSVRARIDGTVVGDIAAYLPGRQIESDASLDRTLIHPVVVGLDASQAALAAGAHTLEFEIYLQAPGSLEFQRANHGHGIHNLEIYGYDLTSQSVGLWDAQGEDVSRNTGNVGIGTDAPQAKLHIAGTPGVDGLLFPDGTLQTSAAFGAGGDRMPLGTILAWHKDLGGTPVLPDGWVECNGQILSDAGSPYNGQTMPDLNNPPNAWNEGGSFLRGGTTSGVPQDDRFQAHEHTYQTPSQYSELESGNGAAARIQTTKNTTGIVAGARSASETRPVNMSVVWIIKVREPAQAPDLGGYAYLEDRRASGTDAGTGTAGNYNTRTLNTLHTNVPGVALAANQFTLPAGTYRVAAAAVAHRVDWHRLRIYNVSDSVSAIEGLNASVATGDPTMTEAKLSGALSIASAKTFELQHWLAATTGSPINLGGAFSTGQDEIYAQVEIFKLTSPAIPPQSLAEAGAVQAFAMPDPPEGWLECDGQAINRATFANLFARIGTTYGAGDGTSTFNVPDLRGEFVRGWDNGRGIDPGRALGDWQEDQFQGHRMGMPNRVFIAGSSGETPGGNNSKALTDSSETLGPVSDGENGPPRTGAETRPRNVSLMYCIKY